MGGSGSLRFVLQTSCTLHHFDLLLFENSIRLVRTQFIPHLLKQTIGSNQSFCTSVSPVPRWEKSAARAITHSKIKREGRSPESLTVSVVASDHLSQKEPSSQANRLAPQTEVKQSNNITKKRDIARIAKAASSSIAIPAALIETSTMKSALALCRITRRLSVSRFSDPRVASAAIRYMSGKWSKELEPHPIPSALEIVNPASIDAVIDATKKAAKDPVRVKEILANAIDRALLKGKVIPSADPQHEYVQGLNLEEAATLLNLDPATQPELMQELYNTALSIKERIYGNRIVLFAPLYLSNYCVNSCTYCAFRGKNKHIPRSKLTKDELIAETVALQKQGHRRLLMLTGEHPKYTFDEFLDAVNTVASVRSDPCGAIRRINVEIPALSVSDLRRLKATDQGKFCDVYIYKRLPYFNVYIMAFTISQRKSI